MLHSKPALLAIAFISVVLLGTFVLVYIAPTPLCRAGGGDIGGPFDLVDEAGTPVTDQDIITGPTLIYFGYTHCPHMCPFDVARNADAVDILAGRGVAVTPVFITIDPARDTPDQLAQYTDVYHPDMMGLTGTDDQIAQAAQAYRVQYQRLDDDPEFYLMDHSTLSYFITPGAAVIEFFRNDLSSEQVADQIACHLDIAPHGRAADALVSG